MSGRMGALERRAEGIMSSQLNDDLVATRRALDGARAELRHTLDGMPDDALARARRGGWSVQRVLQHVIDSEWHYVRAVRRLRELPPEETPERGEGPASVSDAVTRLGASRDALLAALDGIDEDAFYRLGTVGHEEYSVLSILENAASHDREHAHQIRSILASA